MGPNGSGKSTLARALAGHPGYEVTSGEVLYEGKDLLDMSPDERAREGVFMAFQYPVEIPGVNNAYFLKAALNARRKHQGLEEIDAIDFMRSFSEKAKLLQVDEAMLQRSVNEGFSGGEKKRNEIFHMAVLEPTLAILDETDSGLDIDAMKIVANGVNAMRAADRSFIVVTHYQRLLNYIVPDFVHVLSDGLLVRSGGRELALELEEKGYGWLEAVGGEELSMTTVAERHDAVLAEHGRFAQGRGAAAPPWLRDLRARGAARFAALGFPTVRQEEWRFTNVAPIADTRVSSGREGADQRRAS